MKSSTAAVTVTLATLAFAALAMPVAFVPAPTSEDAGTASLRPRTDLSRDVTSAPDLMRIQSLIQEGPEPGHSFYFTRAVYSGRGGFRGRGSWAIDYPKADRQFLYIMRRLLTLLDAYEWENPVRLDDPALRRFPFVYALEVGWMSLTQPEIDGLRGYLEAGGFLVIDDFWGPRQWANFEYQMSLVLPDRKIVELSTDHAIFHQFYDIDEILQVPNVGNGVRGGSFAECYGCPARSYAILDDDGEIMVFINFNTDLGDAWEWSENPYYPFAESTYAYEMAINFILYSLTH